MDFAALIDLESAAIVVGGTVLATILRTGAGECRAVFDALCGLAVRSFDEDALRSDLARMLQEVRVDGLVRTEPYHFRDGATQMAARAMVEARSVSRFHKEMARHRAKRKANTRKAHATIAMAAEIAPAFGLAGTLLALAQLPDHPGQGMNAALAAAVLTTLYGVLLAHLILTPLAAAVRRAGDAEERARDELMLWTARQWEAVTRRPNDEGA